jgi:hypothetical protein
MVDKNGSLPRWLGSLPRRSAPYATGDVDYTLNHKTVKNKNLYNCTD